MMQIQQDPQNESLDESCLESTPEAKRTQNVTFLSHSLLKYCKIELYLHMLIAYGLLFCYF